MRIRKPKGFFKSTCSKCNNELEKNRVGQSRYCRSCANACMRLHRKKHNELSDENRMKANCRSYLHVYIRRGKIFKQPCEVCGDINVQAHHEDYTKPLEVKWLCINHHIKHHKSISPNFPYS